MSKVNNRWSPSRVPCKRVWSRSIPGGDLWSVVVAAAIVGVASSAHATAISWTGAGGDNNWSTTDNWNEVGSPSNDDLTFTDTDRTVTGTVNNIVEASTTISSLTYSHTAISPPVANATWHVTQIGSGVTLTLNGAGAPPTGLASLPSGGVDLTDGRVLTVGNLAAANSTTNAKFTGGGSLTINASTRAVLVTNNSSSSQGNAALDMAGLSAFSADVSGFYIGRGNRTQSVVTLASAGSGTNSITANVLSIADANNGGESSGTSELRLGDSNTLHADAIFVGAPTATNLRNVQTGKISFQTSGLTDPSVTIRGTAGGTTRANLTIGSHGVRTSNPTNTNRSITGNLVDLTGGTVDARLGTVLLGEGQGAFNTQSGGVGGTLSMSAGSIDALAVILGRSNTGSSTNASTGFATGTLNANGGTFTAGTMQLATNLGGGQKVAGNLNIAGGDVSVTGGGITMGTRTGTAVAGTILPTINLTGGSLTVAGNIADGDVDVLDVTSVVNISGGTLDLSSAVAADIVVDTLSLTSTGKLELFVGGAGTNSAVLGSGTATLDAVLAFDLSSASAVLDDSWVIVAPSVAASYGSNFSVYGFIEENGVWVGDFNNTTYEFDPAFSTLTVVPEPASLGLLLATGVLGLSRRARRRG